MKEHWRELEDFTSCIVLQTDQLIKQSFICMAKLTAAMCAHTHRCQGFNKHPSADPILIASPEQLARDRSCWIFSPKISQAEEASWGRASDDHGRTLMLHRGGITPNLQEKIGCLGGWSYGIPRASLYFLGYFSYGCLLACLALLSIRYSLTYIFLSFGTLNTDFKCAYYAS